MPKRFYEIGKKNSGKEEVDYSDLPTEPAAPMEHTAHSPISGDFWAASEQDASVTIDYAAARRRPTRPPDYNLEEHYETPTLPRELEAAYEGPEHFAPAPLDDAGPATAPMDFDPSTLAPLWEKDNRTPQPQQNTPIQEPVIVVSQRQPAMVREAPRPIPPIAPSAPIPALPTPHVRQQTPAPLPTPPVAPVAQRSPVQRQAQRQADPMVLQAREVTRTESPQEEDHFEASPYEQAAVRRSTIGIIVGLGLVLMMFAALLLLVVLAFAGGDILRFLSGALR